MMALATSFRLMLSEIVSVIKRSSKTNSRVPIFVCTEKISLSMAFVESVLKSLIEESRFVLLTAEGFRDQSAGLELSRTGTDVLLQPVIVFLTHSQQVFIGVDSSRTWLLDTKLIV